MDYYRCHGGRPGHRHRHFPEYQALCHPDRRRDQRGGRGGAQLAPGAGDHQLPHGRHRNHTGAGGPGGQPEGPAAGGPVLPGQRNPHRLLRAGQRPVHPGGSEPGLADGAAKPDGADHLPVPRGAQRHGNHQPGRGPGLCAGQ